MQIVFSKNLIYIDMERCIIRFLKHISNWDIHSLGRFLLSIYYVPGIVIATRKRMELNSNRIYTILSFI